MLYNVRFVAVTEGSTENKAFWAATPSGTLTISMVAESGFVPGREYFLDITEA
jgi:hypothetical protein